MSLSLARFAAGDPRLPAQCGNDLLNNGGISAAVSLHYTAYGSPRGKIMLLLVLTTATRCTATRGSHVMTNDVAQRWRMRPVRRHNFTDSSLAEAKTATTQN